MGSRSALSTKGWRRQGGLLRLETTQHRFEGTKTTELSAAKFAPEAAAEDELGVLQLESRALNDGLETVILSIDQKFRGWLKPGQALQGRG